MRNCKYARTRRSRGPRTKVAPSEGPCRPIAEGPPSFRRSRANGHHISFDLPALGELLQNLLKHLGRIVLTTLTTARSSAFDLQHFDGH